MLGLMLGLMLGIPTTHARITCLDTMLGYMLGIPRTHARTRIHGGVASSLAATELAP